MDNVPLNNIHSYGVTNDCLYTPIKVKINFNTRTYIMQGPDFFDRWC
jgi:hypothetical protein